MRLRLLVALALIGVAIASTHLIDHRLIKKMHERDRVSAALDLMVESLAEQLVHLDGIVTAIGPLIAVDDRNELRRSVPNLERAIAELSDMHSQGAMAPRGRAMIESPHVAPLQLMERMADNMRTIADNDELWGEAARFHVSTAHEETVAALPMIRRLQTFEAEDLRRATVRMDRWRAGTIALTVAVLVGVWTGIFRPLERRVAGDREALQEGLRRANEASEAKSRFVATMSHEIRTPLVGILGAAELMQGGRLERDQADLTDIILSSGRSLLGILDDVLDFARIESGRLDIAPEPMDAAALVRDVARLFEAQARAKGVALRHEVPEPSPPAVLGDAPRMRQALSNLAGNAVKFTESGSVVIRLVEGPPAPAGRSLVFEVEDTGPGMSEGELVRVFEAFEQADNSTARRHGGTGLGLAISVRLAEAMGGRISATSAPGRGSCFRLALTLPEAGVSASPPALRVVEGAAGPPDEADLSPSSGMLVLVADDNRTNRLVLTRMLERAGCRVETGQDGAEAVESWRRSRPDLILMDISMPGMDGLAATAAIRAEEDEGASGRTPIVAISAHVGEEHRARCRDAGMDDVVGKPFSRSDLAAVLKGVSAADGVADRARGGPPAPDGPPERPERSRRGQRLTQ